MPLGDGPEVLGEDLDVTERTDGVGDADAQVVDLHDVVLRVHGIVHASDRHEVLAVFRYGELHVSGHPYP